MLKGTQLMPDSYLVKQLPKATVFINADFEILHVSDRWITAFELGKKNILGKLVFDIFNEVNSDLKEALSFYSDSGG